PSASCLSTLEESQVAGERARNDSKGCAGVMRSAPVGLWCARLDDGLSSERAARRALELGAELAGITHGHPTGRLSAGALAALVLLLAREKTLPDAVTRVKALLVRYPGHAETADDLATFPAWPIGEFMPDSDEADYWKRRYPGT